jgi:hypothetical protein
MHPKYSTQARNNKAQSTEVVIARGDGLPQFPFLPKELHNNESRLQQAR